jgi:hypothetical protein
MTRVTVFIVQSFAAGQGNLLKAGKQIPCNNADAARRMAERLSITKSGVVAFSTSGDAELGEFDDQPIILFKSGQLPTAFED